MKKWSDWLDWWDKDSSLELKYIESNNGHTSKMIWSSVNGEGSLEIISESFSDSLKTISSTNGLVSYYGYWNFELINDKTKITWRINGSMPFYARFMTLFTDTIIGKDLERGLNNLKQKLEKINN